MPHYMFQASYNSDAMKAMMANPQDREAPARALIESAGGSLISMYFAMGKEDIVAIVEAPDDETVAAVSMIIGASGAFSSGSTTKLMTPAQALKAMEMAQKGAAAYSPPGG
ncbi:GYD domain-containing protein [Shimia abyssi]|uniref:Uncharacterized protein with GYD domain n=1 Tax=Shimia abyssi TaxID=1662395 RepID=A0A2P8FCJ0_9RHOB|nr:GYD domain-containing protein [Shimia abyssi]PSL19430.1 uncharacterized protein with GYD domain [Shimia abyssi]